MGRYVEVWVDDEPELSIREHWDTLSGAEQQAFRDFLWPERMQTLEMVVELRKRGYTVEPA